MRTQRAQNAGGRLAALAASLLMATSFTASVAHAQTTLNGALSQTYETNPLLESQRAAQRAIDEQVAQAKSGFRPNINGTAEIEYNRTETSPGLGTDGASSPKSYAITLNQPIFEGFQTVNAVRAAEATVREGRELLRRVEGDILLQAVTFYMDVIRDRGIIRLQENNVRVLDRELRATQDRFSVGEVTRTDVSQARARTAESRSDLAVARGNLQASEANYREIVGSLPQSLREPSVPEDLLPRSLHSAIEIGLAENPLVTEATFSEVAARASVEEAFGAFLPTVELDATYAKQFDVGLADSTESTSIVGRVNVPIYNGGLLSSEVRERRQTVDQRYQEVEQARAQVRADVIAAWSALTSARAQLISGQSQVEANRTALAGVREEERVGQRTLLDVLDAEQEFLDAQVALAITRRDLIVAAYAVIEAIGRLTFDTLHLSVTGYDSTEYYQLVESKYWGTTVEEEVYVAGDPTPTFDTRVIEENEADWVTTITD